MLSDCDSITAGIGKAGGKQEEAVIFRKKYPDGTTACVELDVFSEKRKGRVLKFETMWNEEASVKATLLPVAMPLLRGPSVLNARSGVMPIALTVTSEPQTL